MSIAKTNAFACDISKLITLVEKLRLVKQSNDIAQMRHLEMLIEDFRKSCGSPYTDEQITAITKYTPDEIDLTFLRRAPMSIFRSLETKDLQPAQIILNGLNEYIKEETLTQMPIGFRAIIERIAGKTDTPNHHAKITRHPPRNVLTFLPRTRRPRHLTNSEIQDRLKKRNEEE